jgi:hypothetical protein
MEPPAQLEKTGLLYHMRLIKERKNSLFHRNGCKGKPVVIKKINRKGMTRKEADNDLLSNRDGLIEAPCSKLLGVFDP